LSHWCHIEAHTDYLIHCLIDKEILVEVQVQGKIICHTIARFLDRNTYQRSTAETPVGKIKP